MYVEPSKPDNLCENLSSLTHRGALPVVCTSKRSPRQFGRVDGSALFSTRGRKCRPFHAIASPSRQPPFGRRAERSGTPSVGFANPAIYDIGLTRGTATDLYAATFNDVADGVTNGPFTLIGFTGYPSIAGYDLATGWGSPTCALLTQLATPTPLAPHTPFSYVQVLIASGASPRGNGIGEPGSAASVDIDFKDGTHMVSIMLKSFNEPGWGESTFHDFDIAIPPLPAGEAPLTDLNGIGNVTLNLIENPSNGTINEDNWNIEGLYVRLHNLGSAEACQINLDSDHTLPDGSFGLARFSANVAPGEAPSHTFAPAGCAATGSPLPASPAQIQFILNTGSDDADTSSSVTARLYDSADDPPTGTLLQTITLKNAGDPAFAVDTSVDIIKPLTTAAKVRSIFLVLSSTGSDTWLLGGAHITTWPADGFQSCWTRVGSNQQDSIQVSTSSSPTILLPVNCPE